MFVTDCKTVPSFAGKLKIQARSSNGRLGRGNGRADGCENEWGQETEGRDWLFTIYKKISGNSVWNVNTEHPVLVLPGGKFPE